MKPFVHSRLAVIGTVFLAFAMDCSALSLGRARGAVLVGRPLELAIGLTLDAQDDAYSLCLQADVLYGDSKVSDSKVTLTLDNTRDPQSALIRLNAAQAVDEPVVTVFIRAGCAQKVTRRFVVLSELVVDTPSSLNAPAAIESSVAAQVPSLAASLVPRAEAPSVPAAPAQAPSRPSTVRARAASAEPAAATAADKPRPRAAKVAGTPALPAMPATSKAAEGKLSTRLGAGDKAVARTGKSRLKLDALDLVAERDPTLKSSPDLLSAPTTDEGQRSAAAALWRALTAQPQDILRDAERLKALERDLKAARDASTGSQARITDLTGQLAQARSERFDNWLVYTLGGILLLTLLGGGAWYWRQRRQSGDKTRDWWRALDRSDDGDVDPEMFDLAPKQKTRSWGRRKSQSKPSMPLDVDLDVDESMFEDLKRPAPVPSVSARPVLNDDIPMDRPDFVASMPGIPRAVNAEELFDIQQQADFFISLGQYDQAIEVLKTHISDNVETSALAYLDLFKIYHTLERREEFDALREDFNKVFNAEVPSFDNFSQQSNGLESYQTALSRIEALWPSSKVLDIIEESIFRKPGGSGEAFDLEAYRELLLLYAMAKDVVDRGSDLMGFELPDSQAPIDSDALHGSNSSRFQSTAIQPLSTEFGGKRPVGEKAPDDDDFTVDPDVDMLPELDIPKASSRLGLDIDLGIFDEPAEESTRDDLPPVDAVDLVATGEDDRPQPPDPLAPQGDPNLIDFDMFDSALEFELSKRPDKE
jgi:tetratricopeptide (TPR) repeat protein